MKKIRNFIQTQNMDIGNVLDSEDKSHNISITRTINKDNMVVNIILIDDTMYRCFEPYKEFEEFVYHEIEFHSKMLYFDVAKVMDSIQKYWKYINDVEKKNAEVEKTGVGTKTIITDDYKITLYNKDESVVFEFNKKMFFSNLSAQMFFKRADEYEEEQGVYHD